MTASLKKSSKAQILIVDDHPIVRRGLKALVDDEEDMQICGEADDIADALELMRELDPDLILVDVSLKTGSGLDLIKQVKLRKPEAKMLVASMYDESLYAERVLRAGALGYINKNELTESLVNAIRQVLAGEIYLSPAISSHFLSRLMGKSASTDSPVSSLSDRELTVFQFIGEGLSVKDIAKQLHLSPKTIETHREKIKAKLNVSTAAELNRAAIQWNLENK